MRSPAPPPTVARRPTPTTTTRPQTRCSIANAGSTSTFAYDGGVGNGAGNPTTYPGKTFTYNADNQITSAGYVYDGNGNPTTFGTQAVTYDAENRLTSYGGSVLTAGYTGDNLRAWKQTSAGVRTYFLYDGASIVCELSSTGAVTATNTWGANGLLSRRAGTTSSFYTFDLAGNLAQTLNSAGGITLTAAVNAFGQRTASGATSDPYSGFGGQWGCYDDSESGLFLMGARYYDVTTGRFLTRDPLGYAGGINLYDYCANNPVNSHDPSGYCGGPDGGDMWYDQLKQDDDDFYNPTINSLKGDGFGNPLSNAALGGLDPVNVLDAITGFGGLPSSIGHLGTASGYGGWGWAADAATVISVAALLTPGGEGEGAAISKEAQEVPALSAEGQALIDAEPTGSALKDDPYHRSATFMREDAAANGTNFSSVGGDGVTRTLTQIPGELNGKPGRFEYIVDPNGTLTHQTFVEGGSINGIPNKP